MSILLLRSLRWFAGAADAVVDTVGSTSACLVLYVIATLFGQWLRRELVGTGHPVQIVAICLLWRFPDLATALPAMLE